MADFTLTRMTAAEFLDLPESNKIIELINGEVIMAPSPVDKHQEILGNLHFKLKPLVDTGIWRFAPADVHLDGINVVQPDLFWVSPDSQICHLVEGRYWHGAPDLVIEILSPGTTRQDRDTKYRLYEKSGVREYWIVDAEELYIEVYSLRDGAFKRQGIFGLGETFESAVLNGLALQVDALLKG